MESSNIWFNKDISLLSVNDRGKNTLVEHLGIVVIKIGPNSITGTMPVDERTVQPARILHGGGTCVLAESLGSIAANMTIDTDNFIAVGQSITANHLRPVKEVSEVKGIARPLHLGKKSQVWDIEVFNNEEKIICSSRLTMAIIPKFSKN